ncbi:MAG: hypothetical protein V1725_03535 [archaeon]
MSAEKRDEKSEETTDSGWKGFFIVLAVVVLIGAAFVATSYFIRHEQEKSTHLVYNNFDFYKNVDGFWTTTVMIGKQPVIIPSYTVPPDLVNISYDDNITRHVYQRSQFGGNIRIIMDPSYPSSAVIAFTEIKRVTQGIFGINTSAGYYLIDGPAENATYDLPVLSCKNASISHSIIWLKVSNRTEASMIHNCIILEAPSAEELVSTADLLTYKLLKIM